MKRLLIGFVFLCFAVNTLFLDAQAVETEIMGTGVAALSGYDIKATRDQEDEYMSNKAHNTKTELMHAQQIKEATRQANKRKKEDSNLSAALRTAVISTARERAEKDAINHLIDRVLGADAHKNPKVAAKFDDLFSQLGTYAINKNYSGEVIDNNYIAKVKLTVDEDAFKTLVSDMGVALHTNTVRSQNILVILDEFFTAPSDMHSNVLTKEVTTYKYDYNEKDKETTKASYKDSSSANSSSAAAYGNWYGAGAAASSASSKSSTSANYGNYIDYSKNESEFFQNIKEYAPRSPQAQKLNYTQPELSAVFTDMKIKVLDNDMFKSKYFKGKNITSDVLQDSEELVKYATFAKNDAKADFFAIGVSYITDNGVDSSTGLNVSSGNLFIKVYSTTTGESIASGSISESAVGDTADQARVNVAKKISKNLGSVISKRIQTHYKDRSMYGQEFTVEIRGNFTAIEKFDIDDALQAAGFEGVTQKVADSTKLEYVIQYKGNNAAKDILRCLIKTSPKFNNYDINSSGGQIILEPLKGNKNL